MPPSLVAAAALAPVRRRPRAQQERRAAASRRKAKRGQLGEPEGEEGYLARRRVKPVTLRRYREAMRGFAETYPRAGEAGCAIREFDALFEKCLTDQSFEVGPRSHEARDVVYGSAWMRRVAPSKLPAALSALGDFN